MNELARKDLFTCLGIWLALEVIGFGLLPTVGWTQPGDRLETWFIISLPSGIGGAFLIASRTQIVTTRLRKFPSAERVQTRFGGANELAGIARDWVPPSSH